jgi:hypothetical protein
VPKNRQFHVELFPVGSFTNDDDDNNGDRDDNHKVIVGMTRDMTHPSTLFWYGSIGESSTIVQSEPLLVSDGPIPIVDWVSMPTRQWATHGVHEGPWAQFSVPFCHVLGRDCLPFCWCGAVADIVVWFGLGSQIVSSLQKDEPCVDGMIRFL